MNYKSKFTQNIVKNIRTPEEKHHDQVIFALDQLEQVPNLPGKKFVYAHIVAPHAPFVFSPDGRYISNGAVMPGYLDATSLCQFAGHSHCQIDHCQFQSAAGDHHSR